eukprot:scaffold266246_cov20-Tisochrysis_lutea.AAC.1
MDDLFTLFHQTWGASFNAYACPVASTLRDSWGNQFNWHTQDSTWCKKRDPSLTKDYSRYSLPLCTESLFGEAHAAGPGLHSDFLFLSLSYKGYPAPLKERPGLKNACIPWLSIKSALSMAFWGNLRAVSQPSQQQFRRVVSTSSRQPSKGVPYRHGQRWVKMVFFFINEGRRGSKEAQKSLIGPSCHFARPSFLIPRHGAWGANGGLAGMTSALEPCKEHSQQSKKPQWVMSCFYCPLKQPSKQHGVLDQMTTEHSWARVEDSIWVTR